MSSYDSYVNDMLPNDQFILRTQNINSYTQFREIPNAGLYFPENDVLFGKNIAYQSNVAAGMDQAEEYVLFCHHLIYIHAYIMSAFWMTPLEFVFLTQAAFLMDLKHIRLPLLHRKAFWLRLLG